MKVIPVILAGGVGERLWPLSRKAHPKQFLKIFSNYSMFQESILRVKNLDNFKMEDLIVVSNILHRFIVEEQLEEIDVRPRIILEPVGKNTAPSIISASLLANSEDILVVLPSDHFIEDETAFKTAINDAVDISNIDLIVTLSVKPTSPDIGYGYIKIGTNIPEKNGSLVDSFMEKPDLNTAINFIKSNDYLWNSGLYVFKNKIYQQEIQKLSPDLWSQVKESFDIAEESRGAVILDKERFDECKSISIDYALSERSDKIATVLLECGWNDLGTWERISKVSINSNNSNTFVGDVFHEDTKNCFVYGELKPITTLGIEDIVVIDTRDVLFVAQKSATLDIKKIIDKVRDIEVQERDLITFPRKVSRPWGNFDSLDSGDTHQVKKIIVFPGQVLSTQSHEHRAEHWVVVKGTAEVRRDDESHVLNEHEYIYLPLGCIHALKNIGKDNLELIEIQVGDYLGEDDIIRYDDIYGRSSSD